VVKFFKQISVITLVPDPTDPLALPLSRKKYSPDLRQPQEHSLAKVSTQVHAVATLPVTPLQQCKCATQFLANSPELVMGCVHPWVGLGWVRVFF